MDIVHFLPNPDTHSPFPFVFRRGRFSCHDIRRSAVPVHWLTDMKQGVCLVPLICSRTVVFVGPLGTVAKLRMYKSTPSSSSLPRPHFPPSPTSVSFYFIARFFSALGKQCVSDVCVHSSRVHPVPSLGATYSCLARARPLGSASLAEWWRPQGLVRANRPVAVEGAAARGFQRS